MHISNTYLPLPTFDSGLRGMVRSGRVFGGAGLHTALVGS